MDPLESAWKVLEQISAEVVWTLFDSPENSILISSWRIYFFDLNQLKLGQGYIRALFMALSPGDLKSAILTSI